MIKHFCDNCGHELTEQEYKLSEFSFRVDWRDRKGFGSSEHCSLVCMRHFAIGQINEYFDLLEGAS